MYIIGEALKKRPNVHRNYTKNARTVTKREANTKNNPQGVPNQSTKSPLVCTIGTINK